MTRTIFQIIAGTLAAGFLHYGMDLRRKHGSRDFIAPGWQTLMKVCAFVLIGITAWVILSLRQVSASDWMDLSVMTSGTAFIAAAKRALGKAHTFTGQYLEKPGLTTRGIYRMTRNPLYFGVFQCELGASLLVVRHVPTLSPQGYPYWLCIAAAALAYAVSFNWTMAKRESRYLERYFGEEYRRYSAQTPFLFPFRR